MLRVTLGLAVVVSGAAVADEYEEALVLKQAGKIGQAAEKFRQIEGWQGQWGLAWCLVQRSLPERYAEAEGLFDAVAASSAPDEVRAEARSAKSRVEARLARWRSEAPSPRRPGLAGAAWGSLPPGMQAAAGVLVQGPSAQSDVVYVTDTGDKYHRAWCRYLRQSKSETTRARAIADGKTPCSVCRP